MPKSSNKQASSKENDPLNIPVDKKMQYLAQLVNTRFGIQCTKEDMHQAWTHAEKLAEQSKKPKKKEHTVAVTASRVMQIVKEQLSLQKKSHISMQTALLEDLGADELDLVSIIVEVESAFNVDLGNPEVHTVSDVVAQVQMQHYLRNHPDVHEKMTDAQCQLLTSLLSASLQCPPATWMEYNAKKRTMKKLQELGLVRIGKTSGDTYEVRVSEPELM